MITPKASIRKEMRERKHKVSAEARKIMSETVCDKLLSHRRILDASVVIAFAPLPDEVAILPAVRKLYSKGKRVLLPRVMSDTDMVLCEYKGDASLKIGAYGILEPTSEPMDLGALLGHSKAHEATGNAERSAIQDALIISAVVAIVPGMAFDSAGHRLGRGKGYYDRMLARIRPYAIGVAYSFQIIDAVPCDEHDFCMQEVITD